MNGNNAAENIFNSPVATVPQQDRAIIDVEEKRAIAEVQGALIIAKKFPRNPIQAMERINMACARPSLAESALYEYARGGTKISGPSIRLAEVVAQNWGNLISGIIELTRRAGESDCMAYAWDLETNFRDEKRFTVKHIRDTKTGGHKVEAERDIYEVIANQGARRKRACIQAVIPGDVFEEAQNQVEVTLKTNLKITPEKINSLVEKFADFKVTKEMIEKRIQRRLDAITPALMVQLGKIYNSLKDGMSNVADWFETEAPKAEVGLKEKLKAKSEKKTVEQEMAPAECPENPGTTYTKEHCDKCASREMCKVW